MKDYPKESVMLDEADLVEVEDVTISIDRGPWCEAFRFALELDGEHDKRTTECIGKPVTVNYEVFSTAIPMRLARRVVERGQAWFIVEAPERFRALFNRMPTT